MTASKDQWDQRSSIPLAFMSAQEGQCGPAKGASLRFKCAQPNSACRLGRLIPSLAVSAVVGAVTVFSAARVAASPHAAKASTSPTAPASRSEVNRGQLDLLYSTYFGGSGGESGARVAVDNLGNVYVVGTTASPDFPTTTGVNQQMGGSQDAFVAKFAADGSLVYSTYIGGPCEDEGRDIAVDHLGNAYITGKIGLCHFTSMTPGVLVAKIDPNGQVIYQFTFGGHRGEDGVGQAIVVDHEGNAYITGLTQSTSFPTTPGVFQEQSCAGFLADGFVAKVNTAGTDLAYCTYLCGTRHESPNAIAVDSAGHAYIAGSTYSHDFPVVNAFQATNRNTTWTETAFVCKLDPSGSKLIYSTYLGGTSRDKGLGIAVDRGGNAYVTGETMGGLFPTTEGTVQSKAPNPLCYYAGICSDAFVTKFSPEGAVVFSTFVAGEGEDAGERIAVDAEGNPYIVGSTSSIMFPIRKAFQGTYNGVNDAFLTKLNSDGTRILYSTYLGGNRPADSVAQTEGYDNAIGIALDAAGAIYVSGYTVSANFPVTPGAFQTKWGGGYCFLPIAPCGDCFISKLTADGPGAAPMVRLDVTPTTVQPGGIIDTAWAGITMPAESDQLQLYRLGDGTDNLSPAQVAYGTTGIAADHLDLRLPDTLAPGTYELRLVGQNGTDIFGVIARSEPITVIELMTQPISLIPALEPGNIFRLRITGLTGEACQLEATLTLDADDWQVIATLPIGEDHTAEFSDIISSDVQLRFYRIAR